MKQMRDNKGRFKPRYGSLELSIISRIVDVIVADVPKVDVKTQKRIAWYIQTRFDAIMDRS